MVHITAGLPKEKWKTLKEQFFALINFLKSFLWLFGLLQYPRVANGEPRLVLFKCIKELC